MQETREFILGPQGEDYMLRRIDSDGNTYEILLSATDVMDLARIAPQFASQKLSSLSPTARAGGMTTVSASKLVTIRAVPDILGEVILLTLHDDVGLEPTYAIDPSLCHEIATSLLAISEKMISEKKGTSHGH